MSCLRMADGTAIPCTAAYQKWTDQPIISAGSKNSLPLGMGNVNVPLSRGLGTITSKEVGESQKAMQRP